MRALPSPSQEAVVRRVALEEGVDPELLVSVWEQESNKSVDPALTGPVLPQGHKYAGAYGQGPFQIMSFHGEMPKDFEAQARWAAKHLKQKGVRGYYGKTGSGGSAAPTGMPGFPSTDQYEQQVMARMPGAGMIARAGVSDVPQGMFSQTQTPQATQPPMRQETQMDDELLGGGTMNTLASNPWLLIGASILANNDSRNTGKVLGKGLLGGTAAWQAMRQQQLIEQQRQMQIEMARQRQIEEQQQEQMRMEFLRRIQGGGGQPGAGMAPQDLARVGMEGAVMGVPGAGAVMQYGLGMTPYGALTQAQRAEVEDRRARAAYEGVAGASGPAGAAGGLSPKGQQEVYQKGSEGLIAMDVKRLTDLGDKASAARAMMPSLERMIRTNSNVPEGRLAPAQLFAGQLAGSFDSWLGTDFKSWVGGDGQIADAEQFFADSANLIRERIKALGSGTAISNADLLFTRESVPALLQTKEGRAKMLEAFKADAENLQESYKQADKYFRANKGKGLEGFEPQGLKRAGFLKKYYVVGPNGEKYEMVNEAAAKSVVAARPGFSLVVED